MFSVFGLLLSKSHSSSDCLCRYSASRLDPMSKPASPSKHLLQRTWRLLWVTLSKYHDTDGELRAASFAYYAFFALFPLILLLISIGSLFWDQKEVAAQVLDFVGDYLPVSLHEQNVVLSTIHGVVSSRSQAGVVAFLALCWSSLRFFQALVRGINRAWGTQEYSWWRLPLANLGMIGILASTLLLGVVAPVVMKAVEAYWESTVPLVAFGVVKHSFHLARLTIPSLVLFYGLVMFYKYAPRRKTSFREVWIAGLTVTVAVQLLNKGFVIYAYNFGRFNALYGTLGSVVAVLMWIYFSGSVIIFGGCMCAAQAELRASANGKEKGSNSSAKPGNGRQGG